MTSHCEDLKIINGGIINKGEISEKLGVKGMDRASEDYITAREICLAMSCNARVHICHVSTKGSVNIIRAAKKDGVKVTCETAPHYFTFTDEKLLARDADFRMSPPLRTEEDRAAVEEAVLDGTIDCIITDHAPHSAEEKADFEKAPNGVVGLETSLAATLTKLYHSGKCGLDKIAEIMSVNPRKIMGLEPIKIAVGERCDLCIFDPDYEWEVIPAELNSKSKNSVFKGCLLRRPRVRQEADGQQGAEQNCNQGDPKGRLFIVQHPFHTLLHTHLAERQRTGQHRPSRRCAREQRGRIGLPLREAQLPHGPLVAGQLQIPAEAPVGEPAKRLEPVDGQQQIAQRLPPVVAPREMRPLVREDIVPRRAVQPRGQIDPRAEHAQNERRGDRVAEPNILPQQRGLAHAPLRLHQPHERVEEQRRAARSPDEPGDLRPDVERIHAHRRIGAEIRRHQPLVDRAVQRRDPGRQPRHGVISNRIL